MPLQPRDRLGPYEIQALLGVGGMGEVYRGRDTRLGRDVALKVISPKRLGDDDLRRRFELEARAASVLNHPSIVTIYDVGDTGGVAWIAMEWVEGRTLRQAVLEADGPLPLRDALPIARQIAEGPAPASSLRSDVPQALQALIARCLAKRPEDRFASTRELAAALESLGLGLASGSFAATGIAVAPPSETQPTVARRRWPRRAAFVLG